MHAHRETSTYSSVLVCNFSLDVAMGSKSILYHNSYVGSADLRGPLDPDPRRSFGEIRLPVLERATPEHTRPTWGPLVNSRVKGGQNRVKGAANKSMTLVVPRGIILLPAREP